MSGGEIGSGAFFLVGLCAGGCLSRRASVILNVVAMGTVGCGAFVPRSRKLHLLSMGVVRISSSARRPLFFLLLRFLSSCPLCFSCRAVGSALIFSLWDFCAVG